MVVNIQMLKWEELRKRTLRRRQITPRIDGKAINNVTEKLQGSLRHVLSLESQIVFIFTQSRGTALPH